MIKTDSIKYQLLEMVGLCGEFPSGQLNRLIESDSYAEKVVTDLKQSKLEHTIKMAYEVIALPNGQKNCCFRKIPVVFKTI